MNRFIKLLFIILISSLPLSAQDLSGFSFCIDPGHGAGNTNQGPTGLYEMDINLDVSYYLKDYLNRVDADTVILTHYDNSTNPSLGQRENIANNAGVSWFHSVHHNAYAGTARFTLVLMEEERNWSQQCPDGSWGVGTGIAEWPGESDVVSDYQATRIFQLLRTAYTITRLDWTFYGGCNGGFSLGVLNDLAMPGQLSEATFHDHPLEEAKLRNQRFLRAEGLGIYRGFRDYFEVAPFGTATLGGIISDGETGLPVNGATILLNDGEIAYTTDNWNNGIYYFFDMEPGTYSVKAAAASYDTVSYTITVTENQLKFSDITLPSAIAPVVLSTNPADQADSVQVYSNIEVEFSKKMDYFATEAAFSIAPHIDGIFTWENSGTRLVFNPAGPLDFAVTYLVSIDSTAHDAYNHFLDGNGDGSEGDGFSFGFTTAPMDLSRPMITAMYPVENSTGHSAHTIIAAEFNKPLDPATAISSNTFMFNDRQFVVDCTTEYLELNGNFTLTMVPEIELEPGRLHTVFYGKNLSDLDGNTLDEHFFWTFTTSPELYDYAIIDSFSTVAANWYDPAGGFGEIIQSERYAINDSSCAAVSYHFNATDDTLRLEYAPADSSTLAGSGDIFTLAVLGDHRGTKMRFVFDDVDGTEYSLPVTIDWLGWRSLSFRVGSDSLSVHGANGIADGMLGFAGLEIIASDSLNGTLYLDQFALGRKVNAIGPSKPEAVLPGSFVLQPNYPNPFNPETQFNYYIPARTTVTARVFTPAGQLVATLANAETQAAGWHRLKWNGQNVSSGIYLLHVQAGNQSASMKLTLIK